MTKSTGRMSFGCTISMFKKTEQKVVRQAQAPPAPPDLQANSASETPTGVPTEHKVGATTKRKKKRRSRPQ